MFFISILDITIVIVVVAVVVLAGCQSRLQANYIALSFVQQPEDIIECRTGRVNCECMSLA